MYFRTWSHRKTFHCLSWKQPVPNTGGMFQEEDRNLWWLEAILCALQGQPRERNWEAAEEAHHFQCTPNHRRKSLSFSGIYIHTHTPRQFNHYRGACTWLSTAPCRTTASSLSDRINTTMLLQAQVRAATPSSWTLLKQVVRSFKCGVKYFENVTAGAALYLLPLKTGNSSSPWKVIKSCQYTNDSVTANSSV